MELGNYYCIDGVSNPRPCHKSLTAISLQSNMSALNQPFLLKTRSNFWASFAFLLAFAVPGQLWAQPAAPGSATIGMGEVGEAKSTLEALPLELQVLTDSIAEVNQIHGPYIGFDDVQPEQYLRFERLVERADCQELLACTSHENATVRAYAFWGLARKQYPDLEKVLLDHAKDEEYVSEIQGGVLTQIPLIEFMQWVVDPDMLDGDESKKLDPAVHRKVAELRFSE